MSVIFNSGMSITQGSGATQAIQSGTYGIKQNNVVGFAATGGNAATQGTVVTWATVDFDTKNNFNNTTGRFTAPVAGSYYFTYNQLTLSAAGEYRVYLRLNGGAFIVPITILYKADAGVYATIYAEARVVLQVGDFVDVLLQQAPGALTSDSTWSFFQGYKV